MIKFNKHIALIVSALLIPALSLSGCSKKKVEEDKAITEPQGKLASPVDNHNVKTSENIGSQWVHNVKWGVYQEKDVRHVALFDVIKVGNKNKSYLTYHCSDKNELLYDTTGSYFVYAGYPVQSITINNVIYDAYDKDDVQDILKLLQTTDTFKTVIRDNITVGYNVTSLPKATLPCRKTE